MSRSYSPLLNAMKAQISLTAPARAVTRTLKDLDQHTAAEMSSGLFIVIADGVRSYPYETSDFNDGVDGPSQTELGNFEFVVIGRGQLAENATGDEIEDAEIAMINELEDVANAAIGSETLVDLQLLRSEMSGQLIAPYYAVWSRWRVRIF